MITFSTSVNSLGVDTRGLEEVMSEEDYRALFLYFDHMSDSIVKKYNKMFEN